MHLNLNAIFTNWVGWFFFFFFFCVLYVNHSCFQFLMYKRKYEFVCFHRMKSRKGTEALPLDEEYDNLRIDEPYVIINLL